MNDMNEQFIVDFFRKEIDSVELNNGVRLIKLHESENARKNYVRFQNEAFILHPKVHYEVRKSRDPEPLEGGRSIEPGLCIRLDDERRHNNNRDEMYNQLKEVAHRNGLYRELRDNEIRCFAYQTPIDCSQKPEVVITEVWKGLKALYDTYDSTLKQFGTRRGGAETNHPSTESAMSDNTNRTSPSIFDSRNLIYFGAPGTGKSHELNKKVVEDFGDRYERVTFYPTYSYAQFVGCYKPVMKPADGGKEEIAYEFVPGPFLRVLVDALKEPTHNHCLVIEEINRANAAAVFGDVFQLLDRDEKGQSEYDIAATEDMRRHLDKALSDTGKETLKKLAGEGNLKIPANMYIWATMNSADQGVFPMDTAFKRRWAFKYIGIDAGISGDCKKWTIEGSGFLWNAVRTFLIVKPENGSAVSLDQFRSKVLMYLWEDAARMCRRKLFGDSIKMYSDLVENWPRVFRDQNKWEEVMKQTNSADVGNAAAKVDEASSQGVNNPAQN